MSSPDVPSSADAGLVPPPPEVAYAVFGAALPLAQQYVVRLATDGVTRGLIGPREVPRLWERHVLNSAAVAEAVPEGARVVDIGSGAGLPGIPLGLARPDVVLTLVEPMSRRVEFLDQVVAELPGMVPELEAAGMRDIRPRAVGAALGEAATTVVVMTRGPR